LLWSKLIVKGTGWFLKTNSIVPVKPGQAKIIKTEQVKSGTGY